MPIPGLQSLASGIDSAIGTRARRNNATVSEFLDNLQARRAGILDNDDLEFRRNFAEQPLGTPQLNRFDNILNTTTNPFVGAQALIAQAAAAPLLAQRGLQNPAFGQAQGLPNTTQGIIQNGFLGFQPILDQQANAQRLNILNQAPALQNTGFVNTQSNAIEQRARNATDANAAALISRLEASVKQLQDQLRKQTTATSTATPAPKQARPTTVDTLRTGRTTP